MKPEIFQRLKAGAAILALGWAATTAVAEPQHGIAMYGAPALPPDFVSLPQANPDAPKGVCSSRSRWQLAPFQRQLVIAAQLVAWVMREHISMQV